MKITVLLCDHAQEVGGKLYILGGGWSIYHGSPVTMALAVKVSVPWDAANIPHELLAQLLTEDGMPPMLPGPDGEPAPSPVQFQGRFEAGRPAGVAPGSPLDAPFAVNLAGVPLPPGRYEWHISIDDELLERVSFTVSA
jgi:hypothetical protein